MRSRGSLVLLVICLALQGQRREPRDEIRPPRPDRAGGYSIEQATSDRAQLHTIAFDALAFLTGDFAANTFLPPGKVSDFFGFQYMRDIDAAGEGHNTSFLTRIADNMLGVLNEAQRAKLIGLATEQAPDIRRFAEMRLPLIQAFRRNLERNSADGGPVLDRAAVVEHSARLYELDGRLAYRRAQVMAEVLSSLSQAQRTALGSLRFGDSRTWPSRPEQIDRRRLPHETHVAVMTYASEMFSWQAGSLEADTYFCPERHGMYFGGFGMKTAPAMGKPGYSISTTLTGDSGEAFLAALDEIQRRLITALVDDQRADLASIVATRRAIAGELRRFLNGEPANRDRVLTLARRYGELDGTLSWRYANAFAGVARTLQPSQKSQLAAMRNRDDSERKGPFLYSEPLRQPVALDTDPFFAPRPNAAPR